MNRYYLSQPVFNAPAGQIDRENGIIRGITISRIGLAKGHGGHIDKTFLLQIVELASTRPQGIKARFGHPNMCATALGTYLGRFHNYAFTGNAVTADLHLDESAKSTPSGNLYDYVFDMAEKNPDMFGASIVFENAEFAVTETEEDGKKVKNKYFRLKELRATDIVDEPAATDGLFSADSIPGLATQFLDENPTLAEFIFSKPENVIEFLSNYLNNSNMNLPEKLKANFLKFFSLADPALPEIPEVAEVAPVPQVPQVPPAADLAPVAEVASFADLALVASLAEVPQAPDPHPISVALQNLVTLGLADQLSETASVEQQTETLLSSFESTILQLQDAQKMIAMLQSKLAAAPTIPHNVTDPQISVNLSEPVKDESGKQMLKSMPKDLKRKLIAAQP
ncbi:MAG: hypothetical protein Q8J88_11285 [Bacteroidales bacterium]|nr:hypothetical protein [Bacteroidales bacterium]